MVASDFPQNWWVPIPYQPMIWLVIYGCNRNVISLKGTASKRGRLLSPSCGDFLPWVRIRRENIEQRDSLCCEAQNLINKDKTARLTKQWDYACPGCSVAGSDFTPMKCWIPRGPMVCTRNRSHPAIHHSPVKMRFLEKKKKSSSIILCVPSFLQTRKELSRFLFVRREGVCGSFPLFYSISCGRMSSENVS